MALIIFRQIFTHLAIVLSDKQILLISFSYCRPNIVHTIALQAGRIKNSVVMCGFSLFAIGSDYTAAFLYFFRNFENFMKLEFLKKDLNKSLQYSVDLSLRLLCLKEKYLCIQEGTWVVPKA